MTREDWFNVIKTGVAVLFVVLSALAAFGPLAQYRDVIMLGLTILTGVAAVFGIQLVKPTEQVRDIKAHRADAKAAAK